MQNVDVVTQAVLSQCEFYSTWLAAELIKNAFEAASGHKVASCYRIMELFSDNYSGKTCAWHMRYWESRPDNSDDFRSKRLRIFDGARIFKFQLRGTCTRFQNRGMLKFAVLSAVAKFGVDFNKTYIVNGRRLKCCVWMLLFRKGMRHEGKQNAN